MSFDGLIHPADEESSANTSSVVISPTDDGLKNDDLLHPTGEELPANTSSVVLFPTTSAGRRGRGRKRSVPQSRSSYEIPLQGPGISLIRGNNRRGRISRQQRIVVDPIPSHLTREVRLSQRKSALKTPFSSPA